MTARLSFGTAGIRAPLGPEDDQLNVGTVCAVARAITRYLDAHVPDARRKGVCVGFDGRTNSELFARELIAVVKTAGFMVRAFDRVVPTPLLAFSTRLHRAALGVMITASHNPPSDNGIKVYLEGGAQIVPPHDRAIADELARDTGSPLLAPVPGKELALGDAEREAYLNAIEKLVPPSLDLPCPRLAYSALCGVGSETTRALLARLGVGDVHEVASQRLPAADFGGLDNPNPEHPKALSGLLALGAACGAELAFCHDPDADRLAVAVRHGDGLRVLSGDQVGALLADFLLAIHPAKRECIVVSTVVSSSLAERVVRAHGATFERTLTGFKWIAQRGRTLEASTGKPFLYGYEEALGYAFGVLGDDKDGIAAMAVLIEYARRLHARGSSLGAALERLGREHGLCATRQITLSTKGPTGMAEMANKLARLRATEPESLLGAGATLEDFRTRSPSADLLVFQSSSLRMCVRPSGTEPKLKIYLEAVASVAPDEPFEDAEARALRALDELERRAHDVHREAVGSELAR